MHYVSLEGHLSGFLYCLNTQLFYKSKYHNVISLVALHVLGC